MFAGASERWFVGYSFAQFCPPYYGGFAERLSFSFVPSAPTFDFLGLLHLLFLVSVRPREPYLRGWPAWKGNQPSAA